MWMLAGLIIVFLLILWIIVDIGTPISRLTIPDPVKQILSFFVLHLPQILFVVLLIFGILIVINYYKWDLNPVITKKVVSAVEVEGFDEKTFNGEGVKGAGHFCNIFKHSPDELDNQCQELTKENCLLTDCCGWLPPLKNKKCIAGDYSGPKSAIENYELDIMYDPIINVLDHWEHRVNQH